MSSEQVHGTLISFRSLPGEAFIHSKAYQLAVDRHGLSCLQKSNLLGRLCNLAMLSGSFCSSSKPQALVYRDRAAVFSAAACTYSHSTPALALSVQAASMRRLTIPCIYAEILAIHTMQKDLNSCCSHGHSMKAMLNEKGLQDHTTAYVRHRPWLSVHSTMQMWELTFLRTAPLLQIFAR